MRHAARQVALADDGHAADLDRFPRHGALDIAARLDCHVHDHRARFHRRHHVGRENARSRATENLRGRHHQIGTGAQRFHPLALAGQLFRRQLFGIALVRLPRFAAEIDFDELGPERTHLLGGDRTRVECLDPRPETARRGDGLQAGHPDADDENLAGQQRARRGRHHGEHFFHPVGPEHHRDIPAEIGLRGECVHLLRARRARDHFHADDRKLPRGHAGQQFLLVERVEETDMHRPLAEQIEFRGRRVPHANQSIRRAEQLPAVGHDMRPCRLVIAVGVAGGPARPALHSNLQTELDQFFRRSRRDRHPGLAGRRFLGETKFHEREKL